MISEEKVKSFYDTKYSGVVSNKLLKHDNLYISRLVNWLKKNNYWPDLNAINLLDAGCGLGNKTFFLADHVKSCAGIDISQSAIDFCNENHKKNNLTFTTQDISDIKNQKFEIITAFGLSWFNTNDIPTLAERLITIRQNNLASKGVIIATTKTDFSGKSPSGWYYFTKKDIKDLETALTDQAGSGKVTITCLDQNIGYLSQGSMLLALGSVLRRIRNKPLDLIIIFENG